MRWKILLKKRISHFSGLSNNEDLYNFDKIKKIANNLRLNHRTGDHHELMRNMGALKLILTARKKLNNKNLSDFIEYVDELKVKSGRSCIVLLNLVQYGYLMEEIKKIKP